MEDVCLICCEPLQWVAVGHCGHTEVCSACSARLRVVANDRNCPMCKQPNPEVLVTRYMGDYTRRDISNMNQTSGLYLYETMGAYFDDREHYLDIRGKCAIQCRKCVDAGVIAPVFESMQGLQSHVMKEHKLKLCSLCCEGRNCFPSELPMYTNKQLDRHMNIGEPEEGFKGHPSCQFCRKHFYNDDKLYQHMTTEHYTCHICKRQRPNAQFEYYANYDALEDHFRSAHHLCEHRSCLDQKFIVFATEAELRRHSVQEHADSKMSRSEKRQALNLNEMLNFQAYEGGQGRGRGGRSRGRDDQGEGSSQELSRNGGDTRSSASDRNQSAQAQQRSAPEVQPPQDRGPTPGANEADFPGLPTMSKSAKKRAKKKEKERQQGQSGPGSSSGSSSSQSGPSTASTNARTIPTQSLRPPMTPVFDQSHVINQPVHEVAESLDLSDPNSWRNVAHGNPRSMIMSTSPGGTSSFGTENFPTLGASRPSTGSSTRGSSTRGSSSGGSSSGARTGSAARSQAQPATAGGGWGATSQPVVDNTIPAREAERNRRMAELKEQNKKVAAQLKEALRGDDAALHSVRQICGLYQSGNESARAVVDIFNQYNILYLLPDVAELCPSQESGEALLNASIEAQSSKPNSFRSKILSQSSQQQPIRIASVARQSRPASTISQPSLKERNAEVMQKLKDGCRGITARVNEVKQVCTRFQKGQATAEDVLSVFERFEIVELLPDVADICPNPEHRDALIAAHLSSSFQGLPSSSSSATSSRGPQVRGSWNNRGGMPLATRVGNSNDAWAKASKNDWNWRAR